MTIRKNFDQYLRLAKNDIRNFISQTDSLLENYLPHKQFLGCENDFEFIRGWTFGQIHASCMDLFREIFGRKPSSSEYSQILDLIMRYSDDINRQIKSFYSDLKS